MPQEESKYSGCLYYSANALGRVMTKLAEEAFAPTGLAPSYAILLVSVNEKPGIQPKEISEDMQLTPSTVTRLVEKLEMKGFVERKSVGRNTEIYPTAKSKKLDKKIRTAWTTMYGQYVATLGEKKAQILTSNVYEASKKLGA